MVSRIERVDQVCELADREDWQAIAALLNSLPYEDVAEIINALSTDLSERVFDLLHEDIKPDVLSELEEHAEREVVESLTNDELADIVEEMAPDDAADVLSELSDERSEKVLNLMEREESEDVRELLKYDEESAGGIMTTDIIALPAGITVAEAIERIAYIEDDEPFYNAYIVDPQGRLQGSLSLWELIKTRNRIKTLGEICHRTPVVATADMDQEEVAKLMAKYDLPAMPVLDENNKLLGRVTVDDVIDVIEEEATEDIFRLAGSNDMELYDTSPWLACKVRLPWLLITLATGFITSSILRHFMSDFSHVIALSFFVPVVMAMGGNAGIQSSTLVIRSIALGTLEGRSLTRFFGREILAGAIMGLFCGLIVTLWARYLINTDGLPTASHSPYYLAFTIGISLFSAMTFAVFFGAAVPLLLERLHIDPAVASGPFVTSSNDISALLIYYSIAILLILHPLFGAAS